MSHVTPEVRGFERPVTSVFCLLNIEKVSPVALDVRKLSAISEQCVNLYGRWSAVCDTAEYWEYLMLVVCVCSWLWRKAAVIQTQS